MILFFVLSVMTCGFAAKHSTRIHSFAGPFEVSMRNIEPCPQEMAGKNTNRVHGVIQYSREYHEPRFSGTFENRDPVDDSTTLEFSFASWNRVSGWTQNAMVIKNLGKLCTVFHSVLSPVRELLENHEVNHQSYCPRGPGNFTVRNMPVKFPIGKFAAFPYGRYRGDTFFIGNNTRSACVRAYFDIVPLVNRPD